MNGYKTYATSTVGVELHSELIAFESIRTMNGNDSIILLCVEQRIRYAHRSELTDNECDNSLCIDLHIRDRRD